VSAWRGGPARCGGPSSASREKASDSRPRGAGDRLAGLRPPSGFPGAGPSARASARAAELLPPPGGSLRPTRAAVRPFPAPVPGPRFPAARLRGGGGEAPVVLSLPPSSLRAVGAADRLHLLVWGRAPAEGAPGAARPPLRQSARDRRADPEGLRGTGLRSARWRLRRTAPSARRPYGAGPALGTSNSARSGGPALVVLRAPAGTQLSPLFRRGHGGFNVSPRRRAPGPPASRAPVGGFYRTPILRTCQTQNSISPLLAVDHSARASMKNAASCEN
jgi:hypothetical protein